MTYPKVYESFLDGMSVLNFDLTSIFSLGCVVDTDFHDRMLMLTIVPIVILGGLAATNAVAVRRNARSEAALKIVRHKHVSAILLLTSLVYSSVSSVAFHTFACEWLDDDKYYLRAGYRIQCTTAKHQVLQICAGFMILLYPLGIPVLYVILLFEDRHDLRDRDGREENAVLKSTSSDLWRPYKPGKLYYEVIECGRRIILTGAVVFINPNTAAQVAIMIVVAQLLRLFGSVGGLCPFRIPMGCVDQSHGARGCLYEYVRSSPSQSRRFKRMSSQSEGV